MFDFNVSSVGNSYSLFVCEKISGIKQFKVYEKTTSLIAYFSSLKTL